MDSLNGKVVIVTGSSGGIGAATAVEFARLGSKVVITGRNEEKLNDTLRQCEEATDDKENFLVVAGDMKAVDDMRNLVDKTMDHFGQIDVLVNNAGIVKAGTVEQMTMGDFDELLAVNVKGVIQLTQICIPHLKKTKGNIVNMSSNLSNIPLTQMSGYCMTKAALDMFTKLLVIELSPDGVRVNSVNPAIIKTDIFKALDPNLDLDAYCKAVSQFFPLGKVGEPIDPARAVTFLASDAAGFMTGNFMKIDGGIGLTTSSHKNKVQRDGASNDN